MLSRSNNIKLLPRAPIASLQKDRNQILPEIPSEWIDEETLAVGGFQTCGGEGAGGGGVPHVGCGGGGRIEDAAGAGDGDSGKGGVLAGVEGLSRCSRLV